MIKHLVEKKCVPKCVESNKQRVEKMHNPVPRILNMAITSEAQLYLSMEGRKYFASLDVLAASSQVVCTMCWMKEPCSGVAIYTGRHEPQRAWHNVAVSCGDARKLCKRRVDWTIILDYFDLMRNVPRRRSLIVAKGGSSASRKASLLKRRWQSVACEEKWFDNDFIKRAALYREISLQ